ncbi:cell division protein FtsW [Firmicutes bacterium CAG:884]|nr:FtsW/RodA/SpoVE family cell cycle protein [Bacillota bacterium]CCY94351.1 cell division protein FtsW [Firmicutes bacterium CAG:884]
MIKQNLKNMNGLLLFLTMLMFIYGLFNIVTASSREAEVMYNVSLYYYFFRQLKMLILGLIGSFIIINVDTKKYPFISFILYIIIFGLLIYMLFHGTADRGSINWINLPFIGRFQPSEAAKPISIVFFAFILDKLSKQVNNESNQRWRYIIALFLVMFILPGIIFFQNDMGTAFILLSITGIMFLGGPVKTKDKILAGMVCALLICLVGGARYVTKGYVLTEEQVSRITDFVKPCNKYTDGGYQACNDFIAINNGGLRGVGIGESKQKYSYIPEPHTDSVFAIIAEEYGFIFTTAIMVIYFLILRTILKIAYDADNLMNKYICLGCAGYIFLHIIINIGGLIGLLPMTGVPLPFLSYGGTFAISLIGMLAIVQRVAIETNLNKKKVKI